MIGVLTHHWAKDDKIDEARRLLEGNGRAQSQAPGFGTRTTLYSLTDPTKITTLVTWDSSEIYDQWRASPERAAAMAGAGDLWSRPPESERFQLATNLDCPCRGGSRTAQPHPRPRQSLCRGVPCGRPIAIPL